MFKLITASHEELFDELFSRNGDLYSDDIISELGHIIEKIRDDIPEKKRISLGRYSIIKQTGLFLSRLLREKGIDADGFGASVYSNTEVDSFIRSLGIQLMSISAEESGKLDEALSFFEQAASDDDWIVRECSSGFVRKLVKKYPDRMLKWYHSMAAADDPMKRRFASESLRPVADNTWLKKHPDFAFSILEHLYREPEAYPRTSAGNSLSDWMRVDEARALPIVRELADNGDENSYWIAYRACRNLVKKQPLLVMDILKIEHYKYKDRQYRRDDYR